MTTKYVLSQEDGNQLLAKNKHVKTTYVIIIIIMYFILGLLSKNSRTPHITTTVQQKTVQDNLVQIHRYIHYLYYNLKKYANKLIYNKQERLSAYSAHSTYMFLETVYKDYFINISDLGVVV